MGSASKPCKLMLQPVKYEAVGSSVFMFAE